MEKSKVILPIMLSLTTMISTGCQLQQPTVTIVENKDEPVEGLNVLNPVALSIENQIQTIGEVEASGFLLSQTDNKLSIGVINDTYHDNGDLFDQIVFDIPAFEQSIKLVKSEPNSESAASYMSCINELIVNGASIIIIPGQRTDVDLETVVNDNPNIIFLTVGQFINAPNVLGIKYRDEGVPYLLGVAAAAQTKTKQVGYLGFDGVAFNENTEYLNFLAGVKAVDKDIVVKYQLVSSDSDATTISKQAETMYKNGVDILFESLGKQSATVMEVAKKLSVKQQPLFVVNTFVTEQELEAFNDVILTSTLKEIEVIAQKILESYMADQIRTGNQVILGLENEGINLLANNPSLTSKTLRLMDEYQEKLIQGEIIISSKIE